MEPQPLPTAAAAGRESPHCHVPGSFDPDHQRALANDVKRLVGAAQWLARELDEERGCHAALAQAAVIQSNVNSIVSRLVDGHLRYCLPGAIVAGQSPDEIQGLLAPLQSILFARR